MEYPLVTAVITTYNRPALARQAVRSALDQTYCPLEVIVVEDGSVTDLKHWLIEQRLPQVRYVRHAHNRGLAAARNTGLREARGDYVAYLDDDDEWKLTRIARQIELLKSLSEAERSRLGVIYCAIEIRQRADASRRGLVVRPRNHGNLRQAIMQQGPATLSSTCLFPRSVLETVGGYDERLPSSVDHDIWMTLAKHEYEAWAVPDPLVIEYRHVRARMITDTRKRIAGVKLYLQKWGPTHQEWLGEEAGKAYERRYFRYVVGNLAAAKLAQGEVGAAMQALGEVLKYSGCTLPNGLYVTQRTAAHLAHRVLPTWMLLRFREARARLTPRRSP